MRSTRIVSAFVALVLAISLAGLVVSPAQALKPKHDLTAAPGTSASGQTYISGKVTTYKNRQVIIQRKLKGKSYVLYKKTPTNDRGKFRVNVSGPSQSCFKVVVPSTKKYRTTKKFIGCLQ
jgi:hypothetical protein